MAAHANTGITAAGIAAALHKLPPLGHMELRAGFQHALLPTMSLPTSPVLSAGVAAHHPKAGQVFHETTPIVPQCDTAALLLQKNKEESIKFCTEPFFSHRRRHVANHPTQLVGCLCMDGRLNLALYFGLPPGVVRPLRNIGGHFDAGWPLMKEVVSQFAEDGNREGVQTVFLCTYHYAKGDQHRGCAGNGYDNCLSVAHAERFAAQLRRVFGDDPAASIVPIVVGLETDEDSVIFHSVNNATKLDPVAFASETPDPKAIEDAVFALYPSFSKRLIQDIVPLVLGNARHIFQVRGRPIVELMHMESVIAVGRGFDWLHFPNKALIIGPFAHDWADSVAVAATIVLANIRQGRANPKDGIVLIAGAPCSLPRGSYDWALNEEKALYMARVAMEAINDKVPELSQLTTVHVMAGVLDTHTLMWHPILPAHVAQ